MKTKYVFLITAFLFPVIFLGASSATTTITNGIYTVYVDDTGTDIGTYSVSTGENHTTPNTNILYDDETVQTSYLTVRDITDDQNPIDYTSQSFNPHPSGQRDLDDYNPVVTQVSPTQVNVTWNVTEYRAFDVLQVIRIMGTTIDDSRVQVITAIYSRYFLPTVFEVRYLWDLNIAENDGPELAALTPEGPWLTNEATGTPDPFRTWKSTNNPTTTPLTVYGGFLTTNYLSSIMFADYEDSSDSPFTYTTDPNRQIADPDDNYDSALLLYWTGLIIPSGGALNVNAYLYAATTYNPVNPNSTTNTSAAAATSTANHGIITMQNTGMPIAGIILAVLILMGGLLTARRK